MTEKQQLFYLINNLLSNEYDTATFCKEFTRIYDLELDNDLLNSEEMEFIGDLSDIAARFSDNEEELMIPNMYFSSMDIRNKAKEVKQKIDSWETRKEYHY